ncbi:MAG: hypothetical protein KY455_14100 [Euryarchaeota archaeon]|nr:hypothetical protein [Euryarchaeota archaeon]
METISVLVGFLIGVVASAIAVELGLKKLFMPTTATKLTASWRLDEVEAPLVVCTDAGGVPFPRGAEIVTSGQAAPEGFRDRAWRRNANARGNFMVHPTRDRAYLFLGPVQEGNLALVTVDSDLVARLRAEHRRLWETGAPYVEEVSLAEAVRRPGVHVQTRGHVQEVVPYRDRHLVRLVDGNQALGVLVDAPLDIVGAEAVVTGRVQRGTSGYSLLDAEEVRVVRRNRQGRGQAEDLVQVARRDESGTVEGRLVSPAPSASPEPRAERVVRVPPRTPPGKEQVPDPEPEPVIDLPSTAAEKMRAKAKVTLHR